VRFNVLYPLAGRFITHALKTSIKVTDRINQDEINAILWKACDTFLGTVETTTQPDPTTSE